MVTPIILACPLMYMCMCTYNHALYARGGGGLLLEKLGGGVCHASQNPYPIYGKNLRYFLPYL